MREPLERRLGRHRPLRAPAEGRLAQVRDHRHRPHGRRLDRPADARRPRAARDLSRGSVTVWLDDSELRLGLGCMRLSTADERDEELGLQTIAAAVDAGITVFDTARAYGRDATELGHNETAAGPCPPTVGRRPAGADRDEGRNGAHGRRVATRWSCPDDPGRLRGEPRGARWAPDRSLSRPRARPADALADDRPRARTAGRGGARASRGCLERQSRAARRGARARPGARGRGGAERLRRERAPRRDRRPVRGARDRAPRPLPARRARSGPAPRPPRRCASRRGSSRSDTGRDRARVAPRPPSDRRRDPRRPHARGGALRRPRSAAPARARGPRHPRAGRRRALAPPTAEARPDGRRRRRDGDSGSGQEPRRRATSSPAGTSD